MRHSAHLVLSGWPDIPEYNAVGLCAGMEALLEHAGRKRASVSWRAESPLVHFLARWDAR